jgi:hypothetical protein
VVNQIDKKPKSSHKRPNKKHHNRHGHEDKPETTEQLKQLMQQRHSIQPEETTRLLIELENEGKLQFTKPEPSIPTSPRDCVLSKKALWYWAIIALSVVTTISVLSSPKTPIQ